MSENEKQTRATLTVRMHLDAGDVMCDETPEELGLAGQSPEDILRTYRSNFEASLRDLIPQQELVFLWNEEAGESWRNECDCGYGGPGPCRHELAIEGTDSRAHERAMAMTLPPREPPPRNGQRQSAKPETP